MAHVRSNCKNVSISYSAPPIVEAKIKKHRHQEEFDTKSEAITDLIMMGLRYKRIMEKKKAKMSS